MVNIFHEIKRGFLILGFTGPLSSGCTTAANFYKNEINTYVQKRIISALAKIETDIAKKYQDIKRIKDETQNSSHNRMANFNEINKLSHQLKEKLKIRETLSVLSEYQNNCFRYISMTDMLLKLAIEKLSEKEESELEGNLLTLKKLINFDKLKLSKVKEINNQIENREISSLNQAHIEIYEQYLDYICEYRVQLKGHIDQDALGDLLQDMGDNARRCGNPIDFKTKFSKENARTLFILAEEANNIIKFYRNRKRIEFGLFVYNEFVIEAFRNPYEVEYFRNRYYEFFLFSVLAPLALRKSRPNYTSYRDYRDQGHGLKTDEFYKQNVSECVHLSDIAVNNDSSRLYILKRKLSKFFALICRPGCIAPSREELFMQQAYSMSVRSNCISRQVGAVIVGQRNYIVGAGWNDVGAGQVPCGLRRFSDISGVDTPFPIAKEKEKADFAVFLQNIEGDFPGHSFCFKDAYSKFETTRKMKKLGNRLINDHLINEESLDQITDMVVSGLSPKLLQYCRALHAEENAILQNSILGGIGIENATIYTTTFPCELCAKKIYQSRIKKVVYSEPYPESISEDVFFKDGSHSIELVQFEGVKSHSYYRLYKSPIDKKEFQIQEKLI